MLELWVYKKRHLGGISGIGIFYKTETENKIAKKVKRLLQSIENGLIKITLGEKNKNIIFQNDNGLDLCFEIKRNQEAKLEELKQFILDIKSMKKITVSYPRINLGFYIILDNSFDDVEGFPVGKLI